MSDEKGQEANDIKIPKKVLNAVSRRMLLFENSINFERMQSLALTYTLLPVIRFLYSDKQQRIEAMQRHLVFFNSNVSTASLIAGVAVAMEEEKANGKDISSEDINTVKTGLMGPASGIGDALFWGTFVPILGGIAASMGEDGNILAPILHQVARVGVYAILMFFFVRLGHSQGLNLFQYSDNDMLNKITQGAKILAAIVIGGLVASLVDAETGLSFVDTDLQEDVFDEIIPNFMPLVIFFVLFYFLNRRKWSPITLILLIFALGIGLTYFDIFVSL